MLWRGHDLGKWCLGTAQLGLSYGIANQAGQPDKREALAIIKAAWDGGVVCFDTAVAYGESHAVLGACLKEAGIADRALVVTKLSIDQLRHADCTEVVSRALTELGVDRFFGLMCHSQGTLEDYEELQPVFRELKAAELVSYCGVSVYDAKVAKAALELEEIDMIQMPLNVLDRSAIDDGVIKALKASGKLAFFRSALLQGLLNIEPTNLPPHMGFARDVLTDWWKFSNQHAVAPADMALKLAAHLADGYPLVIGAELAEQVRHNTAVLSECTDRMEEFAKASSPLSQAATTELTNPSLWPKAAV